MAKTPMSGPGRRVEGGFSLLELWCVEVYVLTANIATFYTKVYVQIVDGLVGCHKFDRLVFPTLLFHKRETSSFRSVHPVGSILLSFSCLQEGCFYMKCFKWLHR